MTRFLVLFALLISELSVPIASAGTAGAPVSGDVSLARLRSVEASEEGANWLAHGRGYAEQRYSPLGQIDNGNVAQLGLAWSFDVGNRFVMQTTPLAIDGVLYFTAAWSVVHALDAKTGEELWRFDPQVPREESYRYCCGFSNRGVAAVLLLRLRFRFRMSLSGAQPPCCPPRSVPGGGGGGWWCVCVWGGPGGSGQSSGHKVLCLKIEK